MLEIFFECFKLKKYVKKSVQQVNVVRRKVQSCSRSADRAANLSSRVGVTLVNLHSLFVKLR